MAQGRSGKPNVLLCLLPMLLVVLTGVSAQAQPATGKAKADRLVMGLINPYRDYMRPWITGTPDHNIQHDPAFEWLFEVDLVVGWLQPLAGQELGNGQGRPVLAHQVAEGRAIPPRLWRIHGQGRGAQPRALV